MGDTSKATPLHGGHFWMEQLSRDIVTALTTSLKAKGLCQPTRMECPEPLWPTERLQQPGGEGGAAPQLVFSRG